MIGPYAVDGVLGSGGMGRVLSAVSPTGRRVAVKVIREEYAADPVYRRRFAREVEAARRVSGAYTASVIDAAIEGPLLWMATRFVSGPSLADRVHEDGPLAEQEVRVLAYELAEALRDIHRVGLIHRDLKPGNILLSGDGPRVIDFGIARVEGTDRLTQTDAWVGTPAFMAPEQFRAELETTTAADVFALGAVLTYALLGVGPFSGDSPYAIAWNVMHAEPDPLPGPLHGLISRCLAKDPATRPTPAEILGLLRATTMQHVKPVSGGRGTGTPAPLRASHSWPSGSGRTIEEGPAAASPRRETHTGSVQAVAPIAPDLGEEHREMDSGRPRRRVLLVAVALVAALALGLSLWQPWRGDVRQESSTGGPAASGATGPTVVTASWETKVPPGGETCMNTDKIVLCDSGREAVAAYDARSGNRLWSSPRTRDNSVLLAVAADRSLVIVSEGNDSIGPGEWTQQVLRAVDLTTGKPRWSVKTIMSDSAAVIGADLVVGGAFGLTGRDLVTGAEKWRRTSAGSDETAYPALQDGVLMVLRPHTDGASLERLDPATGAVRWDKSLSATWAEWAEQSEEDSAGIVLRSDNGVRIEEFLRFNASGTEIARQKIHTAKVDADYDPDAAVFGPDWQVVRDKGRERLRATKFTDGKLSWEKTLTAGDGGPQTDDKKRVYVRRSFVGVVCLDGTTGREIWRSKPASSGTVTAMMVQDNGTVFVHTSRNTLAAFKPSV
ncbi:serine/threonine-protein kinase [Streptomyces cyaneofuscatus]|uniref:serine/threonine-protein kinase n=1 Tax=Streptomyces cyaneofuscatus TaxID=66883 RepID=UPI00331D6490